VHTRTKEIISTTKRKINKCFTTE